MNFNFSKPAGLLRMFNFLPLFATAALSAFVFSVASLFSSAQANEENPNYTIEVIVFETFALRSWTEEYWPETFELPDYETALPLQDILNGSLTTPVTQTMKLKAQPDGLTSEAAKLTPKKGYRILFHQAWSQDTGADETMPKLLIDNAEQTGSASHVSGTVKLYKSRYAHVEFDLEFERRIPDRVKADFMQHQKITADELTPDYWRFKLKESRKIRPNQLHYIDHPMFGILVQIRYNG
ncbi:CsiV family protein [Thiomicrorhabdus chilensis]|uniref:CsiV family protein n=1 Tax=Thiomicrorhabdus chilensis TaxID=63656 RepID=UPI000407EE75|nr:CsiV family protein [Thiomicrorhabdus chilensis]